MFHTRKGKKFCLFRYQGNMVRGAVFFRQINETGKLVNIITYQNFVVGLANTRDNSCLTINAKMGQLSSPQLIVIAELVYSVRITTTLLKAQSVMNWAHENFIPFWICSSIPKSSVKVQYPLICSPGQKSRPNCTFSDNFIKSGHSVQTQRVNRF